MTDEKYIENGREYYRASGNRVWPRRNREHPTAKPGDQQHTKPLIENELVRALIERLDSLEKRTRPSGGEETEHGKDLAAFQALHFAGDLVRHVAGWAIDHQIGLATARLGFVPLGTPQVKAHDDYIEARAMVDGHEHERIGGNSIDLDPLTARDALINLLLANSGGFSQSVQRPAIEALEALEFGEVTPMVARAKSNQKVKLIEARLQLEIIGFVEFQSAAFGHGARLAAQKKASSVLEIVGVDAIRGWGKRLRGELGELTVVRALSRYANWGRSYKAGKEQWAAGKDRDPEAYMVFEELGGLPALHEAAKKYRHLKRVRKD
jgi:hypothetical protein